MSPILACSACPPAARWSEDDTLDWVEARRWGSDEPVLVPAEWVAAYPDQLADEGPWLIPPITNGLGAGFILDHALAHGLMELLQRDGNVLQYRALDRGMVVALEGSRAGGGAGPAGALARWACAHCEARRHRFRHGRPLRGGATTVARGADPADLPAARLHPDLGRALRKALHEFVGSRARKA